MPNKNNPNVPPPPKAEVSVRTMQSDVERMGVAGGRVPRAQKVAVPDDQPQQTGKGFAVKEKSNGTSHIVLWVVLGVVGAAILFAVGFFVIPALL